MSWHLEYCSSNETINTFWIYHGFSHCFLDTTIASVTIGFTLIFGVIQLWFYRKYATLVMHYALPYSQLFGLQMVLNGVMPFLALLRLTIELFVLQPGILYGYMLLNLAQGLMVWPMILYLILKERNYMLPTVPRKGHGLILLIAWTWIFGTENLAFLNIRSPNWFFQLKSPGDIIRFSLFVAQYSITAGIFLLGLKAPGIPSFQHSDSFTRLHPNGDASGDESNTIGNTTTATGSPFKGLGRKIKMLLPFIWPTKSILLQFYVLICVVLLILGRVTNVYVPIYSKKIVDSMTRSNATVSEKYSYSVNFGDYALAFRWDYILIYVALKVVQGGGAGTSGLLSNLRSFLWISVEQYTTREVEVRFFGHLHHLSLRWHLQRKTGEVLRAMDRGTDSINNILNYLIFSILPTVADIIIAIVYFTAFFNGWFGLIVFVTMVIYLAATFIITEWRTKFRRSMNQADNEQKQQAVDSLLNFETVKYYANEQYETERYANSILRYQKEEWKVTASICLLNMIQLIFINMGLLIGSLLCVKMVVNHEGFTVGDYVLFTNYLLQLYAPLNYFGTYYRMLQRCFIDMENMMDIFKEDQEIKDDTNAQILDAKQGAIEFRDVSFSYLPEREVLNSVSFTVPPGKTVALVGPSGSGKTSIIRLLFRFYDPSNGEILIDGQNIQLVTQESLRKAIGVVPQDTVLFNDTIKYNIMYGRIGSDEEDVFEAARVACINDKILTFPERYDTKVGERGLKLSGGEKQRVAIARTVLKNPIVILLDEATSALDTHTERQIQSSLQLLCENRTSIIVAHRLSTIVNADQILVLKDGKVVESGTHNELMEKQEIYASMWNEQLKSENVAGINGSDTETNKGAGDPDLISRGGAVSGFGGTTAHAHVHT